MTTPPDDAAAVLRDEPRLLLIGETWNATWHGNDAETGDLADWTGWSASMEIRPADSDAVLCRLHDGDTDAFIGLTDGGNITAFLSAERTTALPAGPAVFDLTFTDPDHGVWPAITGTIHCVITEGATS